MQIHIKNMVCNRCKMVVKAELEKLGLNPLDVQLGTVKLDREIDYDEKIKIAAKLKSFGFELLEDKKIQISAQVKTAIINLVHYETEQLKENLSYYLSKQLKMEYSSLSTLFSETENQTIEKYFISQKIEKAKEMLTYGEFTLSELSYQLNYSSVAHLSAQFKKVTGMTPSAYKVASKDNRKMLDEI